MTAHDLSIFGDREPTADQLAAVTAPAEGRRAIDAGAGTGKTTTLEFRALAMIVAGHIRPEELLVVTFTRKAAAEIGERILRTLDRERARFRGDPHGVTCCTIHSLASRILDEFSYAHGGAPPRALADAEARALFDEVMDEAFDGALSAPVGGLPVFAIKPAELRSAFATLVLQLKEAGIDADTFEREGLAAAGILGLQTWGQLWKWGAKNNKIGLEPKPPRADHDLRIEAGREADNVRFAAALYRRFNERLREAQAATYGDLLTQATALLDAHPDIAETLRRRWKHVLIDEFQDTAPAQIAFLRAVFGDPKHPERELDRVTVVGDYRQAIYGFNGADPSIMHRFTHGADAVYALSENRRSIEQILTAAHRALAASDGEFEPGEPMTARRGSAELACVFTEVFGSKGERIADRIETEANAIAAQIAQLRSDGYAFDDIALLLRKRTHAHRYVRALAKRGIPVALDRRSGLLEMPEIRDARAWLRLLVDFDQPAALTLALVRVLQSPQVRLDDEGLAQIAACAKGDWAGAVLDGTFDHCLDTFAREKLQCVRDWLTELLPGRCEQATLGVRRLLTTVPLGASYAGDTQADQRLANLRAFELLAQRFAADAVDPCLPEFVRYCERCVDFEETVEEADLDAGGVAVMTVHQAKGLEWPVVFVPGADPQHYGNRSVTRPVRYDPRHRALVLSRDVDDRVTLRNMMMRFEYDPQTGEYTDDDPRKMRRLDEERRILYVALTRARDRLYVTSPSGAGPLHTSFAAIATVASPWPECGVENASEPKRMQRTTRVAAYEPLQLPLPEIPTPVVSFTALSTYRTCPRLARYRYRLRLPAIEDLHERDTGDDADPREWALEPAAFGSLVHKALELWGQARIDGGPIEIEIALQNALLDFDAANEADLRKARAVLSQAVTVLDDLTLVAAETKFEHEVDGVALAGIIDLIVRDPSGAIDVIDYKTGTLLGDEHYALQLDLYARAMRARYPDRDVRARILRLSESEAQWRDPIPMAPGELEQLLVESNGFTSDEPRPGQQCASCPYNGSPCHAATTSAF
jgi:superfamily I DNA/RNA helicase/RecB family exonuclease